MMLFIFLYEVCISLIITGSSSSETSSTTTTSSSSSDESDVEIEHSARMRATPQGKMPPRNIHHSPSPHEKVIVEPYRQVRVQVQCQ